MKKSLILFFIILNSINFYSQVPQGISYQAVAFNSNGNPIVNSNVGVKISILDNSITGNVVYSETHIKTTNAQGLFNLNIGDGSPTIGVFSTISWETNSKFLKVEVDPTGGTNYTNIGTNQLMSVPYALFADKAKSLSDSSSINDDIVDSKFANFAFSSGSTVYAFNQNTGTWVGQSGSGTLVSSGGNFAFNSGNSVYAFNKNTNTWVGQSGSGTVVGSNGNFAFSSGNAVYAFNQNTGTWVSQSGSGTVVASGGNFAFNSGNSAYAFNKNTNTWVSQSGSGTIVGSNGNFAFSSGNAVYVFSKETNTWIGQSGSGNIVISESN